MAISMDKKYRTRDGREVRLYAVEPDSGATEPVHGATLDDGVWHCRSWYASGAYLLGGSDHDLIEGKTKREGWIVISESTVAGSINVPNRVVSAYPYRTEADAMTAYCDEGQIAVIRIEWEE